MKKHLFNLLVIICLFFINSVNAQQLIDFNHYQPLQASGNVPFDFQLASSEKFLIEKQQISGDEKNYYKKLKSKFYLENSIDITHLLKSGKILFGDPISEYLNKVLAVVLKDDQSLLDSLQIYYLRTDEVNAFTTPDGIVIVSAGLLSQISNEAQLAFILCHEIQHFRLKHALSKYKKDDEIIKGKGEFRNINFSDAELSHYHFSRELESEADMKGLELFLTTDYSSGEINNVFDVLLYSYLPFEIDSLPRDYFNDGDYKMPDKFFTNKLNAIDAKENEDDEKSTHPNIYKRRTDMSNVLSNKSSTGNAKYIVGQDQFKNIRNTARFEVVSLQMRQHNYEDAFYSTYLLLKDFPESEYLHQSKAAALYFLAHYKVNGSFYDIHHNEKEAQGSIQQVYYFFNKIPEEDLTIAATKFVWEEYLKFPSNTALRQMGIDLLKLLDDGLKFSPTDFSLKILKEIKNQPDSIKDASDDKYTMIRQSKSETSGSQNEKYYRFAFANLLNEPEFISSFNKQMDKEEKLVVSKKKKKKGGLAINHLVVANPFYVKLDFTKDRPERYLASESSEDELNKQIQFCAKKLDLKLDIIDNDHLKEGDVAIFNNMITMNDWFDEAIDHPKELQLYNTNSDQLKNITNEYETDFVSWMGIVSARKKGNGYEWASLCIGFVWFPIIPVLVYKAISPNYETDFFTLIVNSKTGKFEWSIVRSVEQNDYPSVVKSNLYYILQQVKSKSK